MSGYVEHGPIKLSTYLINYRVGDIVDIKANAAQQKGMPHKYYHGCVLYRWLSAGRCSQCMAAGLGLYTTSPQVPLA